MSVLKTDGPILEPLHKINCGSLVQWILGEASEESYYAIARILWLQTADIFRQGCTQGFLGYPLWAWHFTKTLLPAQWRLIVFAYF